MLDITQKNLSPPITCFAAIRMQRLKDMRLLKSATDHANRVDQTSKLRVREGADRLNNLAFNPYCCPERLSVATFDYVADFKAMKRATKVVERGGTAPVAHFIAVVSPEWISQAGDVHDPKNPRNIQLFDVAIRWAKENFGDEALLSARMDLDENGAGVVDLFVAAAAHSMQRDNYEGRLSTIKLAKSDSHRVAMRRLTV